MNTHSVNKIVFITLIAVLLFCEVMGCTEVRKSDNDYEYADSNGSEAGYSRLNVTDSGSIDNDSCYTNSIEAEPNFTNSIGMEFVKIPAGECLLSYTSDENSFFGNKESVREVTIKEPFYMGKYEVTQKQWRKVMGGNPSYFTGDDLPVERVSWNDAQEFIKKLNKIQETNKYRLPSEAEWEYACKAGTTTKFYFGDNESKLYDYAWYTENSNESTHPVGQKKPNSSGLYDMYGNVLEWCQDKYHSNYDGAPTDGSAWESGSSSFRVLRSGAWFCSAGFCTSATGAAPDHRDFYFGFRILKTL